MMHEAVRARQFKRGGVYIVVWTDVAEVDHTEPFPSFRRMLSFLATRVRLIDTQREVRSGDQEAGSEESDQAGNTGLRAGRDSDARGHAGGGDHSF